jgi:hypothetical protein
MVSNPRWLDVVRHRIRGVRAPFLLVLQHHDIPATTRLVAPLWRPQGDAGVVSPRLVVDGSEYRVRLLDTSPVSTAQLGETVASALSDRDNITDAIDRLLFGYPIGRLH